ncbi:hypothetical protein [Snuella lapsa]|uniref:Uncharacterized protein n=1 Tax=Snuella lapsa TaxID=870481 RepID=A0ABP6WN57_9FLAO
MMFSPEDFLSNLKENPIDKHQFWRDINKFYKENKIQDSQLFVSCFSIFNELFKTDYASGQFYTWLEKYAESNLKSAEEIKSEIERNPSRDTYEFWISIVFGLSKLGKDFENEIIDNIKANDGYKISVGLRAATIIDSKDKLSLCETIDALINLDRCKELFDEIDWAYLMNFYTHHLHRYPKFDNRIRELCEIDSSYIYSALARALNSYIELGKNEELFYFSIKHLARTPLEYSGIYNTLNFSLDTYFESDPEVIKCLLESWIDYHLPSANGMEVLEHLLNNFNDKNPKYFHLLISNWLLKSHNYGLAVQFLISEIRSGRDALKLDVNLLEKLNEPDTILLTLRIIGFAWDKDVIYGMLLQILESNLDSQEVINNTASLIYSELLLNYPSLIKRLKEEKTSNKIYKSIIDQIIARADEYFERLSGLPVYDEFKPSDKRLIYYNKIQFKGLGGEALENRKSSFLDFADKTQLRAGKGFFSKTEYGYSNVMEPKRISHSMEMPRLEFIDPIGQQAKRLHFRYISKDELHNS